jgi:hypothetical protein
LGIVGREKNIEAEVYSAFYGGQWMKNYSFSISEYFGTLFDVFILDMVYWIFTTNFQESYGLPFGVKYKNYKEHRVLETSSLATLQIQIGSSKMTKFRFICTNRV